MIFLPLLSVKILVQRINLLVSNLYLRGVKIIGGKWRVRKLKVLPKKGLRPSSSRARETLFNWLSPYITDATCLDIFSGSGALAFESLSRGAGWVTMVDHDRLNSAEIFARVKINDED